MKKTLVLIRHAKSSWANPLQSDYERPLNERGEIDAPEMGRRLKERKIIPDLIIASSAKRTTQTAKKIAKEIGYSAEDILWKNKLYHCVDTVFEEVIREVDDEVHTLFIVAHNPGITEFANELSEKFRTDHVPTCAVIAAQIKALSWSEFVIKENEVFLFDYPKKQA